MAVDKLQKVISDVSSINNGLQGLELRFNDLLITESFGTLSNTILGSDYVTTINLESPGLKGKIPKDALMTLTHPDGLFPVYIQNKKQDYNIGDTTIEVYINGTQSWEQVIDSGFGFPKGSLLSSPGYAQNDSYFAAGNNDEVQYNASGQLTTDAPFNYDPSSQTLSTPNATISGTITGDVTGDLTGDVTGNVTGNLTGNVTGNLTGNVTGNLTGNVTGNVTGDVTGDLTGNADTATNLTAGNKSIDGNLTIGSNNAGHDLLVHGNASYANMLWDATYNFLKFTDSAKIVFGTGGHASDFDSSIQANGSNLVIYNDTGNVQIGDTVEITGDLDVDGDLDVGAAGAGHNLTLWGSTYGEFAQWDGTYGQLNFSDNTKVTFGTPITGGAFDSSIYANGSDLHISNSVGDIKIGDSVEITGDLTTTGNITGNLTATSVLADGVTATTQSVGDNSTKVATTEFVLANAGSGGTAGGSAYNIQYKDLAGGFAGASLLNYTPSGTHTLTMTGILRCIGATALGDSNNVASGQYALAVGTTTTASSKDSASFGELTEASGRQSTSFGYDTLASGDASTSFGALTTASGERSTAFGAECEATGENSFAIGGFSEATGLNTFAQGYNSNATGDNSVSTGSNNNANALNSYSTGQNNTISNTWAGGTGSAGTNSFVGGYGNNVQTTDSLVFGSLCNATTTTNGNGANQFLLGLGLEVPKNNNGDASGVSQTVVGKYNYDQNQEHLLFSVGYGTDTDNRATAFVVKDNGYVGIAEEDPDYRLHLYHNSAAKPVSSSWTVTSDERVKTNIRDYDKGLEDIIQINPKIYDFNGKAGFDKTQKDNVGVIAQEIQGVFPKTINTYNAKLNEGDLEKTELLNFDSHELTYALINSVKELNAEVKALRNELNELKNK